MRWVCDLVRQSGARDPATLLQGMWRAGYLKLIDDAGTTLQPWQCEQLWREGGEPTGVRVAVTELGAGLV